MTETLLTCQFQGEQGVPLRQILNVRQPRTAESDRTTRLDQLTDRVGAERADAHTVGVPTHEDVHSHRLSINWPFRANGRHKANWR